MKKKNCNYTNFLFFKKVKNEFSLRQINCYSGCKFHAFSLAEMMVVMLIMSIVLAAMAPMITTRIKADQALKAGEAAAPQEDNNPWKWVEGSDTDAYSQASRNMIGQTAAEEDDGDAMLIINKGKDDKNDILFKNSNGIVGRLDMWNLYSDDKGLILGATTTDTNKKRGSISIGFNNALGGKYDTYDSVILGYKNSINNNSVDYTSSIAIGMRNTTTSTSYPAIAIGINCEAGDASVAIGRFAEATERSMAIQGSATKNSIAIGSGIRTTNASGNFSVAKGPFSTSERVFA